MGVFFYELLFTFLWANYFLSFCIDSKVTFWILPCFDEFGQIFLIVLWLLQLTIFWTIFLMLLLTLKTLCKGCLNSARLRFKESSMEIQKEVWLQKCDFKSGWLHCAIVTSEMNATSGGVLFYIRKTTKNTALNYINHDPCYSSSSDLEWRIIFGNYMDKTRVVFYFLWSVDDRNMSDPFSKARNLFFRYPSFSPKNHSNG